MLDSGYLCVVCVRRGKTGLINLGNTCYLNSALQCLSHTYPITMHLLTNRFKDDLNEHSPLGTGGRLAREYEALVKELWLGSSGAVSPSGLKKAISRIAPQFAGNSQHDAQEVLINLLDRLHEDLNRVKKKPYIKAPEDDDRPDSIQGPEAWQRLKQREDSVLYDTLYGQFKSQLMCGVCRKVSTVFDPFGMVTLEIPDVSQRRMHILLFPNPPTPAANDKAAAASSNGADTKPKLLTLKVARPPHTSTCPAIESPPPLRRKTQSPLSLCATACAGEPSFVDLGPEAGDQQRGGRGAGLAHPGQHHQPPHLRLPQQGQHAHLTPTGTRHVASTRTWIVQD
jgi:hypothetical protein